jgi:hypothetical protein
MALFDDLQTAGEGRLRPGVKCVVGQLLTNLDDKDRGALVAVLDESQVSAASLSRLLHNNGHSISHHSISNHRRRALGTGCRCEL